MKKAISILMCVLFVLTILYPVGVILTAFFGYTFRLISVSAFAFGIALLSICVVILDLIFKNTIEGKPMLTLLTMITPLSLLNAVFYIFKDPQIWVIASMFSAAACSCYLTIKYGKPFALKIIALVLTALMVAPIGFFSFFALIFGNIGQNTVVKTVASPNGEYYAQVIDSDQGALGGDTLVMVHKTRGINALLFRIEKKPQNVYFGNWGEFKSMRIHWKDDKCLVINAREYAID